MMKISRRRTLLAGTAAAGWPLIPGRVMGAGSRLNVAAVGIGNRGHLVMKEIDRVRNVRFVAQCDVGLGQPHTQESLSMFSGKKFTDFREMFDEMADDIDAVLVSTPDFSHFPAAMTAMALGKHVYVEKPLARTFQECELLMAAEKKYGVVTQMGNQGHSGLNYHQFKAWREAGIIKDVTHVDAYMQRSRRWHPWGDVVGFPPKQRIPSKLDWDLWLGTSPLEVDYNEKFHPGNWRGWHQFGTGCFGDWGAHILDTIHRFLELGLPDRISPKLLDGRNDYIFPLKSIINFHFPERKGMPAMDIDWYDGKDNLPPIPEEFKARDISGPGKFIYSRELTFQGNSHGQPLQIIPYNKMRELLRKKKLPRDFGKYSNHYESFINACRGDERTTSPFSVSGPLTQMLILGCIVQRLGVELEFDREAKRITNNELANSLLKDDVRPGWEQFYKL